MQQWQEGHSVANCTQTRRCTLEPAAKQLATAACVCTPTNWGCEYVNEPCEWDSPYFPPALKQDDAESVVIATINVSAARSIPRVGYNTVGTFTNYSDRLLAKASGSELGSGLIGRYPGGTVSDFWLWRTGWVNTTQGGQWADLGEPLHNTVESFASFIKRAGWAREQLYCLNAIQGTGADQLSMLEEAVVAGNNHSTVGFIELGNELFAGDRTLLEPQTCAQTIFPCEKSMSFDFSVLFRMQIQHRQPMHIRWRRG